jgi:hypothetical protein
VKPSGTSLAQLGNSSNRPLQVAPQPRTQGSAEPTPAQPASATHSSDTPALTTAAPLDRDPSRIQRLVQQAISSPVPGLAAKAAAEIQLCIDIEFSATFMREVLEDVQREKFRPRVAQMLEEDELRLRSCQALDAFARSQLVPLIRSSLKEGDLGAAADLVQELKADFHPQQEPEAVAALKRDAWGCHDPSISAIVSLAAGGAGGFSNAEIATALRLQNRGLDQMLAPMSEAVRQASRADRNSLAARYPAEPSEVATVLKSVDVRCRPDIGR